jgi:hypothetical protein
VFVCLDLFRGRLTVVFAFIEHNRYHFQSLWQLWDPFATVEEP